MKLIREQWHEMQVLEEAKEGQPKTYYIEGIYMQSNIKNRNGRLYPREILENAVNKYNTDYVTQKRAFGELGHPDSPTINLDRVSHLITSLKCEGNDFIGKAKILDTPNGRIVKSLLGEGVKLGVSSRGMGTLKEQSNGVNVVQDNFLLSTAADIVADPSAPSAFVNGIMENREWIYENGIWHSREVETVKEEVIKTNSKDLPQKQLEIFELFMNKLAGKR